MKKHGDLGDVAMTCKSTQRLMFPPPPLTVRGLYKDFFSLAKMEVGISLHFKLGKQYPDAKSRCDQASYGFCSWRRDQVYYSQFARQVASGSSRSVHHLRSCSSCGSDSSFHHSSSSDPGCLLEIQSNDSPEHARWGNESSQTSHQWVSVIQCCRASSSLSSSLWASWSLPPLSWHSCSSHAGKTYKRDFRGIGSIAGQAIHLRIQVWWRTCSGKLLS